MNLMISWSKPQSKTVATALHDWLPSVLPGIEPWISSKDIDKGREWFQELQSILASTKVCIICVTEENVRSPWIYYEVGAIATNGSGVLICPYLINIDSSILSGGPLAQWQCTNATHDDTWDLIKSLNANALSNKHDISLLQGSYETRWRDLESKLCSLPSAIDIDNTIEGPVEELTDVPLTSEATELLLEASQDPHGKILYIRTMSGTDIKTNGKNMIEDQSARTVAKWKGALDLLLDADLIETRGYEGSVFAVTDMGYNVADSLRDTYSAHHETDSGSKLEENTEKILQLFFDEAKELNVEYLSANLSLQHSIINYHLDILRENKLIIQTRAANQIMGDTIPPNFSITARGREYIVKKNT
ncbi:TIR domain-containing protein [Planctomycetota bacterium]